MYNNEDIMAKLEVVIKQNELLEAKIEKVHIQAEGLKAQNELLTDALFNEFNKPDCDPVITLHPGKFNPDKSNHNKSNTDSLFSKKP